MEFHLEARSALRIVGICGIVGVLVDLDHAIALLLWRYWNPAVTEGRIWHTPLFIAACVGICCLGTRIGRLHHRFVLIGAAVTVVTVLVLVYSPLVIWGLTK